MTCYNRPGPFEDEFIKGKKERRSIQISIQNCFIYRKFVIQISIKQINYFFLYSQARNNGPIVIERPPLAVNTLLSDMEQKLDPEQLKKEIRLVWIHLQFLG